MMMRMKLMAMTLVRPISDCVVIWIFSIPTEAKLVKDSISVIKVLSVNQVVYWDDSDDSNDGDDGDDSDDDDDSDGVMIVKTPYLRKAVIRKPRYNWTHQKINHSLWSGWQYSWRKKWKIIDIDNDDEERKNIDFDNDGEGGRPEFSELAG